MLISNCWELIAHTGGKCFNCQAWEPQSDQKQYTQHLSAYFATTTVVVANFVSVLRPHTNTAVTKYDNNGYSSSKYSLPFSSIMP